jgi:hypothetical protein
MKNLVSVIVILTSQDWMHLVSMSNDEYHYWFLNRMADIFKRSDYTETIPGPLTNPYPWKRKYQDKEKGKESERYHRAGKILGIKGDELWWM